MVFCCDTSADDQEQGHQTISNTWSHFDLQAKRYEREKQPQVVGVAPDVEPVGMPRVRPPRTYLPSHTMALTVTMKCIPLNARPAMKSRFQAAVAKGKASVAHSRCICATPPVQWFAEAFGPQYRISRVTFASDVLSRKGQWDDQFQNSTSWM